MSVEIVATDTTATVFTWAEAGTARKHNDVYWDNSSFAEIGSASATEQATQVAEATQDPGVLVAPTDFPMPTPDDTGKTIYYVKQNDNLTHIATIACGETMECVEKIRLLNPGVNLDVVYPGQKLIINEAQSGLSANENAEVNETPVPVDNINSDEQTVASEDNVVNDGSEDVEDTQINSDIEESTPNPDDTGAICVALYSDLNGNGVLDFGETLVSGGSFGLVNLDTGETVDTYTTDGTSEPYCFADLATGTYRVISTSPVGHTPTTRVDWDLTLATGSTANLEFGAQFTGEDLETATVEPEDSPIRPALMGAFGVMLLLSAAGIAGYMVISRRR